MNSYSALAVYNTGRHLARAARRDARPPARLPEPSRRGVSAVAALSSPLICIQIVKTINDTVFALAKLFGNNNNNDAVGDGAGGYDNNNIKRVKLRVWRVFWRRVRPHRIDDGIRNAERDARRKRKNNNKKKRKKNIR